MPILKGLMLAALACLPASSLAETSSQTESESFDNWSHGRVQLKDVSIHFRYAGSGPPLLLVHGNPQHSLTWRTIGPILADQFTIIAPDNRGTGDSSIPANSDYSARTMAGDLRGLLDFLKINSTYVFSHDKGVGAAVALSIQNPDLVASVGVAEYALPGFGYETISEPAPTWDLYANWQLAFFSVTDAAEFFIQGRVKEMLSWYFFHSSYSGTEAIPESILQRYTTSISKPGFLRGMLGPFSTAAVNADREFFTASLSASKLRMPMLALGSEASVAPDSVVRQFWGPVGANLSTDIVPKAGHWSPDENPVWIAKRLRRYFGEEVRGIEPVDLSWLADRVTLV